MTESSAQQTLRIFIYSFTPVAAAFYLNRFYHWGSADLWKYMALFATLIAVQFTKLSSTAVTLMQPLALWLAECFVRQEWVYPSGPTLVLGLQLMLISSLPWLLAGINRSETTTQRRWYLIPMIVGVYSAYFWNIYWWKQAAIWVWVLQLPSFYFFRRTLRLGLHGTPAEKQGSKAFLETYFSHALFASAVLVSLFLTKS